MTGFIKKSLFAKIFLIICLTVFLINVIVGLSFRYYIQQGYIPQWMRPLDLFLDYIIADIGNPPDRKKIDRLSGITGFDIYIENFNLEESVIDFKSMTRHKWAYHQYGKTLFFLNKGMPVAVKEISGKKIYFIARDNRFTNHDSIILRVILFITLVLFASYLMIKRSLRPVKHLTRGMNEIASGNFNYIIPDQGGDELGRLGETFNEMNGKLLEMIKLKEQLLYDVSHELRSPLTRVNVALEMIEQNDLTESMRDDLRSMDKMIRNLLENGRFDGTQLIVNKEELHLKDLMQEIIAKLNSPSQIIVQCDELKISGDREKAETLFRNIIENGIKYSPVNSPVTISAFRSDTGVTVSVRDHGIGIKKDDLQRIFEPFYRTDLSRSRETGGFGLGLSISKKIASAHGGKIWAESDADGTVFHVFFPG